MRPARSQHAIVSKDDVAQKEAVDHNVRSNKRGSLSGRKLAGSMQDKVNANRKAMKPVAQEPRTVSLRSARHKSAVSTTMTASASSFEDPTLHAASSLEAISDQLPAALSADDQFPVESMGRGDTESIERDSSHFPGEDEVLAKSPPVFSEAISDSAMGAASPDRDIVGAEMVALGRVEELGGSSETEQVSLLDKESPADEASLVPEVVDGESELEAESAKLVSEEVSLAPEVVDGEPELEAESAKLVSEEVSLAPEAAEGEGELEAEPAELLSEEISLAADGEGELEAEPAELLSEEISLAPEVVDGARELEAEPAKLASEEVSLAPEVVGEAESEFEAEDAVREEAATMASEVGGIREVSEMMPLVVVPGGIPPDEPSLLVTGTAVPTDSPLVLAVVDEPVNASSDVSELRSVEYELVETLVTTPDVPELMVAEDKSSETFASSFDVPKSSIPVSLMEDVSEEPVVASAASLALEDAASDELEPNPNDFENGQGAITEQKIEDSALDSENAISPK